MNYNKTLKKVEKQLDKDNSTKTENRLIVIKNALKQIIREEQDIKNDIMTTSKAARLLKETPLIDINGQVHKIDIVDEMSSEVHISLCDPGNWVTDADGEDLDEDILSRASFDFIADEIKRRIPGAKVDQGELHLADVEFIIELPYIYNKG